MRSCMPKHAGTYCKANLVGMYRHAYLYPYVYMLVYARMDMHTHAAMVSIVLVHRYMLEAQRPLALFDAK